MLHDETRNHVTRAGRDHEGLMTWDKVVAQAIRDAFWEHVGPNPNEATCQRIINTALAKLTRQLGETTTAGIVRCPCCGDDVERYERDGQQAPCFRCLVSIVTN